MAKQKLDTRVDQLARWIHTTYRQSPDATPCASDAPWKDVPAKTKANYRYVARQLIENPPACLTQQTASVQQPAATEQQP